MRKCPFCSKQANSHHHIVPRSEGGKDEPRNMMWLCVSFHDYYEGQEITPPMITSERLRLLGKKATSHEEYHFRPGLNGLLFMGIKLPDQKELIGGPIPFPYGAQFTYLPPEAPEPLKPIKMGVSKVKRRQNMGRPPIILSPDMLSLDLSVRENAKRLGLKPTTVYRRLK